MKIGKHLGYFSASHRLLHSTSPCHVLHGHNYAVEVTLSGSLALGKNMILDFSSLNDLKPTIAAFDHKTLLNAQDPLAEILLAYDQKVEVLNGDPTVENLVLAMGTAFCSVLDDSNLSEMTVRIWETEKAWAECSWVKSGIEDNSWKLKNQQ